MKIPAFLAAATGLAVSATASVHDAAPEALRAPAESRAFTHLMMAATAPVVQAPGVLPSEPTDPRWEKVSHFMSPEIFAVLRDVHINLFAYWAEAVVEHDSPMMVCLAPDSPAELFEALEQFYTMQSQIFFQQTGRWSSTALSGGGLGQGDPTIITYSYVQDGEPIPDQGFGSGTNELFSWMNGIYGSPAVWQPIFDEVFARWAELIGTEYVYEPNDDGANLHGPSGVSGVRGDVRISADRLDGNSGVLAYNFFPNNGDMVFDAFDSFYNNTGNNSLRFRNVIAHEHGHGLGMLHVCPANQTKLMEPFVSTAYDGPQLDDILNGQRHYGDNFEPNDSIGTAEDLGNAPAVGNIINLTNISIDDNSDSDFFQITAPGALGLTIVASPDAATYDQGPQTSACNSGASTNYNTVHDLRLEVYNAFGQLIAAGDSSPEGQPETLSATLPASGDYYVAVRGDSSNNIQRYRMSILVTDPPFVPLTITQTSTPPSQFDPGVGDSFTVSIANNDETLVGSPQLNYRASGGAFASSALVDLGGGNFRADLAAPACGDTPEFYISAIGDQSGEITLPFDGAADPFTAIVGDLTVVFEDNFQTNQGWTVSGDATDGQWNRGVPVDAGRGDPSTDGDGSGQCYLTDNSAANGGNSDVDNGETILTSPVFDLSAGGTISWLYWFNDTPNGEVNGDSFRVQTSVNGGGTWNTIRTITTASSEWIDDSETISAGNGSANFRFRVIANDIGTQNVIEAGFDGFSVESLTCEDPDQSCNPADIAEPFGTLDIDDVLAFLDGFASSNPVSDIAAPTGVFNIDDVLAFLDAFAGGCP